MAVWNASFENSPAGAESPSLGDDRIRELKAAIRERLTKEHHMDLTSGSASEDGWHEAGSAKVYVGASPPTHRPGGTVLLDAEDDGRLWLSSDDFSLRAYRHAAGSIASERWEVVSGSGGSGGNYVQNDLTKPGVAGVTGTGFTNLVWDAAEVSIIGTGALKADAPVSGTGRYFDVALKDLDPNNLNHPWFVKFSYKLNTAADDLVTPVMFDGTNEYPIAITALPYAGGTMQTTGGAVLPNNVLSGQKLRFKFKDNTAITFYLADVSVGPQNMLAGAAVGATQTYPLTIGATTTPPTKGTVVEDIATWARVGDKMVVSYFYRQSSAGSTGSGIYLFPLPSGYTIDLTKTPIGSVVGSAAPEAVGVSEAVAVVKVHDATRLIITGVDPAGSMILSAVGSTWFTLGTANIRYKFSACIPIAQWTSNVNLASDFQEFASNSSSTNADDTTSFAYGPEGSAGVIGVTNLTTTRYKRVRFLRPILPTDVCIIEIFEPGSAQWVAGSVYAATGGNNIVCSNYNYVAQNGGMAFRAVAGSPTDLDIAFFVSPAGLSGVGWNTAGILGMKWRVRKISNGNMAEVPPLIHLETGDNATAASGAPIIWSSKVEDPYNMLNLSTGIITVPMDGLYDISIGSLTSNVSETEIMTAAVNNVEIARVAIGVASGSKWGTPCKLRARKGDQIKINHSVAGPRVYTNARMTVTRIGS